MEQPVIEVARRDEQMARIERAVEKLTNSLRELGFESGHLSQLSTDVHKIGCEVNSLWNDSESTDHDLGYLTEKIDEIDARLKALSRKFKSSRHRRKQRHKN